MGKYVYTCKKSDCSFTFKLLQVLTHDPKTFCMETTKLNKDKGTNKHRTQSQVLKCTDLQYLSYTETKRDTVKHR